MKERLNKHKGKFFTAGVMAVAFSASYFILPQMLSTNYGTINTASTTTNDIKESDVATTETIPEPPKVTHIKVPDQVKAIYVTSWVAGTKSLRDKLIKLADDTEVNAVVIDIKDYTGTIAFEVNDPELKAYNADSKRIADLDALIKELHEKNIYIIGRIAAFQDPHMVKANPGIAVKRASDGAIWKDHKGITWIDAGAKENWDYLALIAKESYARGFDEINYDYIRFPSDGNMNDIAYPYSKGKVKHVVLAEFFKYITEKVKSYGAYVSVDLFGMTTTNYDDLNIGQVLEDALPYFDFVAPMVYPSHYPATWNGFKKPAENPYEVVKISMTRAAERATEMSVSSTTPQELKSQVYPLKLRPWLQDFNLGATYTPAMVRAQIKATYDSGLNSWMMWNASNVYTKAALLPEGSAPDVIAN
ncbi:MAG: putative glycoside hydrolase [Candidatus Paceibacterota bacterium]